MRFVKDVIGKLAGRDLAGRPAGERATVSEKRRRLIERMNSLDTGPHVRDGNRESTEVEQELRREKERPKYGMSGGATPPSG